MRAMPNRLSTAQPIQPEPLASALPDQLGPPLPDSTMKPPMFHPSSCIDDATVTRVLNTLRAEGLFDHPPRDVQAHASDRSSPDPMSGRRTRRLAGPVGASARRTPALAWCLGALLLAGVALAWLGGGTSPGPRTEAGPVQWKNATTDVAQKVHSSAPDAEAAQLVALLADHGLTAEVVSMGGDRLVRARIPASATATLEPLLTAQGLVTPSDGRLAVQFAP